MDRHEKPARKQMQCTSETDEAVRDTHSTLNLLFQREFAQCFFYWYIGIVNNRHKTIDVLGEIDDQTMMIDMANRTLGTIQSVSTKKQEQISITFTRLPTLMSV